MWEINLTTTDTPSETRTLTVRRESTDTGAVLYFETATPGARSIPLGTITEADLSSSFEAAVSANVLGLRGLLAQVFLSAIS